MSTKSDLFYLKGSREYVHGTDIFDHLTSSILGPSSKVTHIEITFSRRILNTACIWTDAVDERQPVSKTAPCRGKYRLDDVNHFFSLEPQDEPGERKRIGYDESEITKDVRIMDGSANMNTNGRYSFIENLVALTKKYHNQKYKPEKNQWMFGKLCLFTLPGAASSIEIREFSMIPNRLSKCEIFVEGEHSGHIFFTIG